ncbi:MAG: hypothetical protein ACI9MR_000045 [Myxococcota bacterium]|jgi:hypothetical protein
MPTTDEIVSQAWCLADPGLIDVDMSDVNHGPDYQKVHDERQTEAWTAQLMAWFATLDDKIEGVAAVRRAKLAQAKLHDTEAKMHARRAQAAGRAASRLDDLALALLRAEAVASGKPAVGFKHRMPDGCNVGIRVYKSQVLDVTAIDEVPPEYVKVSTTVDKASARRAMRTGQEIPGLALVDRESIKASWPR